jgi:hypothetical protein
VECGRFNTLELVEMVDLECEVHVGTGRNRVSHRGKVLFDLQNVQ